MNVKPPEHVLSVLRALEAGGSCAFLVGGCVRDVIMGRRPNDWDVCTDAAPDKVGTVFPNSRPTGIKHGTVTVISGGHGVEVTTFRTDGAYADHRRPDSVEFISDLRGDLARRDFTINAMAMSEKGDVFDPFGGASDIAAGVIRCVGDADKRFGEDALRMLRALRFSAVLGFEIEERTVGAIVRNAGLIRFVAPERISAELGKTLLSPRPEKALEILEISGFEGSGQLSEDGRISRLKRLPRRLETRLSGLCAVLVEEEIIEDAKELLTWLRLPSSTVKSAAEGCIFARKGGDFSDLEIKRLIAQCGESTAICAAAGVYLLRGGSALRRTLDVIKSNEACKISDLAVSGDELLALGFSGKKVGDALRMLLDHVLEFPTDNERETLLLLARSFTRD